MEGPQIATAHATIDNGLFGTRTIKFETGRLARQAAGSVAAYLDDETMKILAQTGEFVNRKGIYPPLPGAEKIQYVQMDVLEAKAFEDKRRELGKMFLK